MGLIGIVFDFKFNDASCDAVRNKLRAKDGEIFGLVAMLVGHREIDKQFSAS